MSAIFLAGLVAEGCVKVRPVIALGSNHRPLCYTSLMKFISENLGETVEVARTFVSELKPGDGATVVALEGDLGSGKTTFTQEVGKLFGVVDNMHSPTFVIMKIYQINWRGFRNLIHIDAYRLEKEEELLHLGWEEIINEPENIVFIEWPERVLGIIPSEAHRISFKFVDENTREISYEI